MKEKNTNNFTH